MYDKQPPQWPQPQPPAQKFDPTRVLVSAVAASRALVDVSRPVHVLGVAHSLCLQTGKPNEHLAALFRRQRRLLVGLVAMGVLLLACMGGLAVYLGRIPWGAPGRMPLLVLSMVCLAAALACFYAAAWESGWLYRKAVQPRLDELKGTPNLSRPSFLEIEYPPEALSTAEPTISDVGYVICAPAQRRIIIEGVLLRHVIRAEDVADVRVVETIPEYQTLPETTPTPVLRVTYKIDAQTQLVVGVRYDSMWADFLRDYFGRQPVFEKIRAVLA